MQYILFWFGRCAQGKCTRREPACKYLHPPQHLKELLLQNGRNNLILRNLQNAIYQKQAVAAAAALTMAQLQQVGQLGVQLPISPLIQLAPDAAAASRLSHTAAAPLPVVRFSSDLIASLFCRCRCRCRCWGQCECHCHLLPAFRVRLTHSHYSSLHTHSYTLLTQ